MLAASGAPPDTAVPATEALLPKGSGIRMGATAGRVSTGGCQHWETPSFPPWGQPAGGGKRPLCCRGAGELGVHEQRCNFQAGDCTGAGCLSAVAQGLVQQGAGIGLCPGGVGWGLLQPPACKVPGAPGGRGQWHSLGVAQRGHSPAELAWRLPTGTGKGPGEGHGQVWGEAGSAGGLGTQVRAFPSARRDTSICWVRTYGWERGHSQIGAGLAGCTQQAGARGRGQARIPPFCSPLGG